MRLTAIAILLASAGCASAAPPRAPAPPTGPRAPPPAPAPPPAASPPPAGGAIGGRTASLRKLDGFLPLHWDDKEGKLFLEIPRLGDELIYQVSLAAGVGSNPIGLDRNQLGDTRLVRFDRVGPKVLLLQPNQRYRAIGGGAGRGQGGGGAPP